MASSHRPPLPLRPHPIASAFFNAHDDELLDASTSKSSNNHDTRGTNILAICNSLGWRTRYASSELYPVSILPVKGRRRRRKIEGKIDSSGIDENEVESFHVRQVFPRESNRSNAPCTGDAGNLVDGDDANNLDEDDCKFGTGATVWPGSIVLLKYLEKMAHSNNPQGQQSILQGKTVADLGSGTAITSVASALLGARLVVCTDGCDPVVELARRNIHEAVSMLDEDSDKEAQQKHNSGDYHNHTAEDTNNTHCTFRGCEMIAQKYLWGEGMKLDDIYDDCNSDCNKDETEQEVVQSKSKHFDIILGADCIVPKLYPIEPLVDAIDELSGNETITYLSYEQRHYQEFDPAQEFCRLAAVHNLNVEVIPDSELNPMFPANDIEIWKVTRDNTLCASKFDDRQKSGVVKKERTNLGSERSDHKSLLVGSGCKTQP